MQSIPFVKSHRRTASGRKQMDITIDVEALTNDEKLSRSLHTGMRRKSSSLIERPKLFEWFIIIGVPPIESTSSVSLSSSSPPNSSSNNNNNGSNSLSSSPNGSSGNLLSTSASSPPLTSSKPPLLRSSSPLPPIINNSSHSNNVNSPSQSFNKTEQPKILYQYPPDKSLSGLSVEFFPFPNGVAVSSVSQTASHTNLFQVLYPQKHLKQPEDSFIFMLTDEKKDVLYGVCTTKISSIGTIVKGERFEVDINDEPCSDESIPQVGDLVHTSPRCFCILTKYPFFPLHFDIISGILSLQHMQEITKFQNLMSISTRRSVNKKLQSSSSSSSTSPTSSSPSSSLTPPQTPNNNNNNNNSSNNTNNSNSNDNSNNNNNNIVTTKIIITDSSSDKNTITTVDPLLNNSTFKVRERPILELIEYFYNQPVPNIGDSVSYTIKSLGEQKIQFKRNPKQAKTDASMIDYGDYMLKYGLFTTVQLVQPKTLIILLNAILLEKKILFYSKTIRSLTSVIFTVLSLLSPFTYQSVILPLLPNSVSSLSVCDLLAAPVPYIIGLTDLPKDVDYSDIVLFDIDTGKLTSTQKIMLFPYWEKLLAKLNETHKEIKTSLSSSKKNIASPTTSFVASEEQELKLVPYVESIYNHINGLFENYKRHCVRNVTFQQTISVFVKESFMFTEYPEELHHQWIDEFTKTQMFTTFLDNKLRTEDNDQLVEN